MTTALTAAGYMTKGSHTIGPRQVLRAARAQMKAERIRQLPVLDGRRLVGLLSERDLEAVASLAGTDLLLVEDAMVPDVFITSDDAPLAVVASEMAARKVESAVVVRGDEVVGVLTSVDTLRALADVLLAANVSQVALSGVAA